MIKRVLLIFLLFFIQVHPTWAITNPINTTNNKFGIHIVDENDLPDAAKLVNSSGGDWGYAKIVIQENDRSVVKWQTILDKMRRLHLIPIVRLATKVENANWIKPRKEDIGSWVDFLSSLNWVTQNRYIVIFNEPNHANEWGGMVNPEEYAQYLKEFSQKLKEKSPDFFILPAGLDASAPNSGATLDEVQFIKRMVNAEPDIFDFIDGWSSHSYPNPDFSGSPYAIGRGTVRTFQWEQGILAQFGKAELPIFILETGWKHAYGRITDSHLMTPDAAAQNYRAAFSFVWTDPQIVAITPFLLNYQDTPFDHFSFKKIDSSEFYSMYDEIASLPKQLGAPIQLDAAGFTELPPTTLVKQSDYHLAIQIENHGESIISSQDGWTLELRGLPTAKSTKGFDYLTSYIVQTEPFQNKLVDISLKTPSQIGIFTYSLELLHNGTIVATKDLSVTIIPPPEVTLKAKTLFSGSATGNDYKLIMYDSDNRIIEERDVTFNHGISEIQDLYNVIPNRRYRLVLIKPYYLPRQIYATLTESQTTIGFPALLPFDPSGDGAFSWADIKAILNKPVEFFRRLFAL